MVQFEVDWRGALVREGKSLSSKQVARLTAGAIVEELERAGERLRFKKVSGTGPDAGWVSVKLLAQAGGAEKKEAVAATQPYQGSSLLARAEATVLQHGAAAALAEATSRGKDGASLVLAAAAYLADSRLSDASTAASEALELLKSLKDKEGEASATLALASALLAQGQAQEALGLANTALALFKEVGDRQMEASALTTAANAQLAGKEVQAAITAVEEALVIFRQLGDAEGEAAAQLTLRDARVALEGPERALQDALSSFQRAGDTRGEAFAQLELAALHLASEGGETATVKALAAAERARLLFLVLGDKGNQGLASHAVAQGHLHLGDLDPGMQAAMQAVVLARAAGDK